MTVFQSPFAMARKYTTQAPTPNETYTAVPPPKVPSKRSKYSNSNKENKLTSLTYSNFTICEILPHRIQCAFCARMVLYPHSHPNPYIQHRRRLSPDPSSHLAHRNLQTRPFLLLRLRALSQIRAENPRCQFHRAAPARLFAAVVQALGDDVWARGDRDGAGAEFRGTGDRACAAGVGEESAADYRYAGRQPSFLRLGYR